MRFECNHCHGILAIENCQPGEAVACGHCSSAVAVPESTTAPRAVIGDFIVRSLIGTGGMGRVFLAHQISLDRAAAVKILHQQYALDSNYIKDFVREARAAAALNHPTIVQAYAVGEDAGNYFFAMEYVEGSTVKETMEHGGRMVVERALMIAGQVTEALDFAWTNKQLVHRDIKPDNIILTTGGKAKLADLGLARWFGDAAETTGDIYGTPQYISPEQLLGRKADNQSDIYSLGATLYHMLSGDFPFNGDGPSDIAQRHLTEPLTPLCEKNAGIPENVSDLVTLMLAKRPCHRYEDTAELLHDLRRVQEGEAPSRLVPENILLPLTEAELAGEDSGEVTPLPSLKKSRRKITVGGTPNKPKEKSLSTTSSTPVEQSVPAELAEDAQSPDASPSSPGKTPGGMAVAAALLLGLFVQFVIAGGPIAGAMLLAMSSGNQPASGVVDPETDNGKGKIQVLEEMIQSGAPEESVVAALANHAQTQPTTADDAFNVLAAPYREEDLDAARQAPMEEEQARWKARAQELADEAEESRQEAERKAKEDAARELKEQAEREKAEKLAAQKAKFQADQATLRERASECCRANEYEDANDLFVDMMGEKYQESHDWATGMQTCIGYAKSLYERIYNSRGKLAGVQIALPGKKGRWTVTYIGPRSIELKQTLTKYRKGQAYKETFVEKLPLEHMTAIHVHSFLKNISESNDISLTELCRDFAAFLLVRNEHVDQVGKQLDKAGTATGQEFMRGELKSLNP